MGHTILLADDSITIQKVIELTFSDEDFKLHTVSNGQKAIDEIRAVKPDVVLCDIIMPEKNGYEVCEFIKTNADLKHIPVLLLTGAFEPFDQERARQAGCDGFLAKPFEPQTLISKVRELLAGATKPTPAAVKATPTAAAPLRPAAAPPAPASVRPAPPAPVTAPARVAAEPEATVVLPFSQQGAQQTQQGHQAQQAPPPPADVVQDFAYEVGDRELAVEPGDRNLFIEPDEHAEPAEPVASVMSEDIWGQVQEAQPAPAAPGMPTMQDEGATVMMQTPLSIEPSSEDFVGGAGFDELVAPSSSFEPPRTEVETTHEPAEPELTPMGDFGFDAFAATDEGGAAVADADVGEATMLFSQPPAASPAGISWESAGTAKPAASASEPAPASEPSPSNSPWQETAPSSSWGADEDAGGTVWAQEPMPLAPAWEEPAPSPTPAAPAWEEPSVPAEAWEDAVPATVWEEAAAPSPAVEPPPDPRPPKGVPKAPEPAVAAVTPPPTAPAPPPIAAHNAPGGVTRAPLASMTTATTAASGSATPATPAMPGSMDTQQLEALAEKVAEKVISKISAKMIQEIAWEVVPDLAESLIRKEIEALKAKIPR